MAFGRNEHFLIEKRSRPTTVWRCRAQIDADWPLTRCNSWKQSITERASSFLCLCEIKNIECNRRGTIRLSSRVRLLGFWTDASLLHAVVNLITAVRRTTVILCYVTYTTSIE